MKIYNVSISNLCKTLEAISSHRSSKFSEIANFTGLSESSIRKSIPSLLTLGLVEVNENDEYITTSKNIKRGVSEEAVKLVIKKYLLNFEPFELLCEGLALGEPIKEAKRKTVTVLDTLNKKPDKLDRLRIWGEDLGILKKVGNNGKYELSSEINIDSAEGLDIISASEINSEAKVRILMAKKIGRKALNYLDKEEKSLLTKSIINYQNEPAKTIENCGKVTEDFLRRVTVDNGYSEKATKLNGAGQLANFLVSKSIIHANHLHMVNSIGGLRNAKAHNKDKRTLDSWKISRLAAFWGFLQTLTLIKSIHLFSFEGRQKL